MTRRILTLLVLFSAGCLAQGPAYPYLTNLSWTDSTTPGTTGQNVYRGTYSGTACSAFTKLTLTPLPPSTTTYTDSNPAMGAYCYAVTALATVNNQTIESGYSNTVSGIYVPPAPPTGLGVTIAQAQGKEKETFAWIQSKDGSLKSNSIYCKKPTATTYSLTVKTQKPATKVVVSGLSAGDHQCFVTANNAFGTSGQSNLVDVNVP